VGYSGVASQLRKIYLLSRSTGTQFLETGEGLKIADINNLAHIFLNIGCGVIRQPLMGRYTPVII
jgi:hypothetical protein